MRCWLFFKLQLWVINLRQPSNIISALAALFSFSNQRCLQNCKGFFKDSNTISDRELRVGASWRNFQISFNSFWVSHWFLFFHPYFKTLMHDVEPHIYLPIPKRDNRSFSSRYSWPNFIVGWPLIREILCNMCIAIVCCDAISFEINLYFSNEAIFSTWPKSQDKNLNILRTERTFKMK